MASTASSSFRLPSLLPPQAPTFCRSGRQLRPHRLRLHPVRRKPLLVSACSPQDNPNGAGGSTGSNRSWVSPDWLTSLSRSLSGGGGGDSRIPYADAKLDDVSDLLGGALFLPLFKWMLDYGPIYRLAAGPRNFVVVSDPAIAKHVLRNYGKYAKGLVSEVSEFLFGSGFAIAEGALWTVRRRAVTPSLHRKYLSVMVDKVFCRCAQRLVEKLQIHAMDGTAVNMEEKFSQLTLDVIGLSLFNYNFDSLASDSPVIEAVYTALKEAEARSTDILPYWKLPILCKIIPRQIKAEKAVSIIRNTVEELIIKCKEIVEAECEQVEGEEYVNETDPSILRFLLASREEVTSIQLRDDLLSMLVAGHETTGSVLTWTIYLLSKDPSSLKRARHEVDEVLQGRPPRYEDVKELKYLMRCIHESLRLYPHPPVLIRRAQSDDVLPGDYKINAGQDIMISVYNIHRSPKVWERAEEFFPERFSLEGPVPNETNTDFRFIPFSGGPRKCIGDQFALLEAIVALAIFLQHMKFELVADQKISMTTGATIHTTNGLYMTISRRKTQHNPVPSLSVSSS
ncbi:carotene epsilon-monooxygenase, chloroplastic-like [Zingiber officinale]|uniref:carotene epsilon-monooxygenase, chloroplastic-like n=1 Tax=Zingiber officinale TaxID=94328 RepID=UPI001C4AC81F|nr:carotene epsilon-monooxygenase, chloroplastic-like [Zingiber officinale]